MPEGANVKPTDGGFFLDLAVPKGAKKSSRGHLCGQADGKEVGKICSLRRGRDLGKVH